MSDNIFRKLIFIWTAPRQQNYILVKVGKYGEENRLLKSGLAEDDS